MPTVSPATAVHDPFHEGRRPPVTLSHRVGVTAWPATGTAPTTRDIGARPPGHDAERPVSWQRGRATSRDSITLATVRTQ